MNATMFAMIPHELAAAASTDIWSWAQNTMGDVYTKILGISTIAGVLCAIICLIWRMVSANPKSVEICNTWLKRILVTWIIINVLGFIINYVQPLVKGGQYTASSSSAMITPMLASVTHFAVYLPHLI